MGKGVPAGLLMTLLRGNAAGPRCSSGLPPIACLHDVNALAQEDPGHSHRLRDAVLFRFDPLTRVLRYAHCGPQSTTDCRREGYRVERLMPPGLLIGPAARSGTYGCQPGGRLEPGDVTPLLHRWGH